MKKFFNLIIACLLAMTLIFNFAVPAFSKERTDFKTASIEEIWDEYEIVSLQVAENGESLNDIYYQLDRIKDEKEKVSTQITQTEKQLELNKDSLANIMSSHYKIGASSLVDFILNSTSFENFIKRIYYLDRYFMIVSSYINETKSLQESLLEQQEILSLAQEELESLSKEKQAQTILFTESLNEQVNFINNLSDEQKEELSQLEQQNIEEQKENLLQILEEENVNVEQLINNTNILANEEVDIENSTEKNTPVEEENIPIEEANSSIEEENNPIEEETLNQSTELNTSTLTSDARAAILAAAYSQLGVTYVYGASSPGEAFDCSGLTSWAYSQAGIEIPHSSAAQAQMATNVSSEDLQPGDLVFYIGNAGGSQSGNHVALYAGDGQVIHANGSSVVVSDLNENYTSAGNIGL